jgi:hypothetical protein
MESLFRFACGVLAVMVLFVIIYRRKRKAIE